MIYFFLAFFSVCCVESDKLAFLITLMFAQLYFISGCSGVVVEYRTRNREVAGSTHTLSTASNLEQVANLCVQANSASYPQRDGKWVVATATGWKPSVADWGDGVTDSCTVGHCPLARAMDGHIKRCGTIGMPTSCHFRDCKALLVTSLTHVTGAITSVQTFYRYVCLYLLTYLLTYLLHSVSHCNS